MDSPVVTGWTNHGFNPNPPSKPVYVGYWQIGGRLGIAVHREKRPPWIHRFMCKLVFGIEWRDGLWGDNKD